MSTWEELKQSLKNTAKQGYERIVNPQTYARKENPYGQGTRAYEMYEANPWTWENFNQQRQRTWWDNLVEGLGLRSGYQAAQAEYMASAAEYDAQIAEINAADKYNSPEAQAARMRDAGQNPDLLGTQGVAEAEEFANKEERTSPNVDNPTMQFTSFVEAVGKTFVGVVSMGKDMATTLGLFQEAKGKKLDNAEKLEKLVDEFMQNYTPERGKEGTQNKYDYYGNLITASDKYADNYGLSKKQKQQFWEAINARLESNPGKIYERDTGNLKARKEWGQTYGSKYTTTEDDIQKITTIVNELIESLDISLFNRTKEEEGKSQEDRAFQETRSGMLEGLAHNTEQTSKNAAAEMKNEAKKAIQKATQSLGKAAKEGNWFALILESLLPGLYLKFVGD